MSIRVGLWCFAAAGVWANFAAGQVPGNFHVNQFPGNANTRITYGNPLFVNPGINQAQYLANVNAMAQAAQTPSAFLYPRPVQFPVNTGAMVNPANPYVPTQADGLTGTNPYAPTTDAYSGAGYNPYYPPYYGDGPWGGVLRGQADVMRAYGTVITSQEQARIMREQANWAKLETLKRKKEFQLWLKSVTPTHAQEAMKAANERLKRIQNNSSEAEIINGTALNFLLDDLRKYPGKKPSVEQMDLSEETLQRLNVTKNSSTLGILRNDGKFTWPIALMEILPADFRKDLEQRAEVLVQKANQGKTDVNVLRELYADINKMRELLAKNVDYVSDMGHYLEAKRFLNDLNSARLALERGEASTQFEFKKWAQGGKTLQQLVDYMVGKGLRFGGATQGDEGAYRALHSGMAAFDVALNAQLYNPTPPIE